MYSRKILWLKVVNSNNDPHIISIIYLDLVSEIKIASRRLRSDCGTENGIMAAQQCFFHFLALNHMCMAHLISINVSKPGGLVSERSEAIF